MKYLKGNLLTFFENNEFDIIVHGCNCFHTMGAGIAKQIKQKYETAYQADLQTEKGSREKLGTYSIAQVNATQIIINAYTQYHFYGKTPIDYQALRCVFKTINQDFPGKVIGIPKIGSGLAKGDWKVIEKIIQEECTSITIICVIYEQS